MSERSQIPSGIWRSETDIIKSRIDNWQTYELWTTNCLMTDTEILEDLKKILHKQFDIIAEDVEEDSFFDEDLNIAELDLEDLLATVEEKYNLKIDAEKIPTFNKVSDLVSYIYENVDQAI